MKTLRLFMFTPGKQTKFENIDITTKKTSME